jgi:hypothetical protein
VADSFSFRTEYSQHGEATCAEEYKTAGFRRIRCEVIRKDKFVIVAINEDGSTFGVNKTSIE